MVIKIYSLKNVSSSSSQKLKIFWMQSSLFKSMRKIGKRGDKFSQKLKENMKLTSDLYALQMKISNMCQKKLKKILLSFSISTLIALWSLYPIILKQKKIRAQPIILDYKQSKFWQEFVKIQRTYSLIQKLLTFVQSAHPKIPIIINIVILNPNSNITTIIPHQFSKENGSINQIGVISPSSVLNLLLIRLHLAKIRCIILTNERGKLIEGRIVAKQISKIQ